MKDWKYIKTGNANVEGVLGSQYTNPNSAIAQEIYREYISSGKNKEKALVNLVKKHPSHDSKTMEKAIDAVVEAFEKRTLNVSIDKQEWSMFNGLRKDAEKELGNSTVSEYNAEIQRLTKKAEELRRMGQGRSAMEIEKQIEKLGKEMRELGNKKTGNEETKAERKFGKVMGEFEEGALKTPQGKTVTDPAQAKAIAYSEADKVDNLKRARNAMKK